MGETGAWYGARKGLEVWPPKGARPGALLQSAGAGAIAEPRKARFFAAQPQKMRPKEYADLTGIFALEIIWNLL
jgi:hypothetical protein